MRFLYLRKFSVRMWERNLLRDSPSQHPSRNELRSHKTDTDGFVVGVRGTSVSLSKNATTTQLAIVDSTQSSTGIAAVITCRAASDSGAFYRGTQTSAKKYSTGSVANAVCLANLTQTSPTQIYASQNWIRANTLKDIEKMSALATDANVSQRVVDELKASLPKNNAALSSLIGRPVDVGTSTKISAH